MGISVFLPTRKGSERVIGKNTREFATVKGGLLRIKLEQLVNCMNIDEIVLSSNDDESLFLGKEFAEKSKKVKVIERPEHLALSSTSLIDLVKYVPNIVSNEHILWTHVTSPFITSVDYDEIIEAYFSNLLIHDSLMTVKKIQNFLWDIESNDIINRVNTEKWPRTQDLKPYYEVDSGVFISSVSNYKSLNDRIGKKPYLFVQEGIKSFDVDWEEDFKLGEILYSSFKL
jgi:CMP-N-acetylneuraminic acid synthetase